MKFKLLILIIAAGCSASLGSNSQSPIIGFPPNSPEAKTFIDKINNAGLYQIHQGNPSDTNFVIKPDGSFYVGVTNRAYSLYSVLTDTNAIYSMPAGSYIHYYGMILTADNKLMEAEYKINPTPQEISNAQNTSTFDQLYARYRTVTNIDWSKTSDTLALPKSNP